MNKVALSGELFKLTFKIADDAKEGAYAISMYSLIKDNSVNIESATVSGSLIVISDLIGDVNLDGKVNIEDALLLFRHSIMPDLYPITYPGSIDFTKDGAVNIEDALLLFRYSMMPDLYPLT